MAFYTFSKITKSKMKRLLIIILLLAKCIAASAQTNFKVSDNSLVWQKVYNSELSAEGIMNALYNSGAVADIGLADGVITCQIPATPIDFEGAGFSRGAIPMYIPLNDLAAFATIQIKDGRYRVTVDNLYLISNMDTALGRAGEKTSLSFYGVKNGQPSRQLYKYIDPIIGRQLDLVFSLKKKDILTDDW